jgi:hypothetical protein
MTMRFRPLWIGLLVALAATGCGGKQVTRVGTGTDIDLSGRWNDADSRRVSEAMIAQSLSRPWVQRYIDSRGSRPTVIVGIIRNKTSEHISANTFVADIESFFINDGTVRVVATAEERGQLRDERADQGRYASEETIKKFGRENGADYMMTGTIDSIIDRSEGEEVRYYQVDLTLIDIETNEKVWVGQEKIKKYVGRSRYSG